VKADRGLGARLSPRQTHAYGPLKRAVRVLGTKAVDRRTRVGKALDQWRTNLIADLGGLENISTQGRALIDEAVLTKLILSSINVWMLKQPSLVSNKNRGVLPVVLHRNQLVATLKGLLEALGLERRAREVPSLEAYLASKRAEAKPPHHAQVQPRDTEHRFVKATPTVSETNEVAPDEQPAAPRTELITPATPADETTKPGPSA
jgi:hypothetical protein